MTEQFPELVKDTNAQIQEASKSQAWKSCLNPQPDEKGATGYNWELPSQPQQAKLHKASHQESVLSIHWKHWCWIWSSSTLSRLYKRPCCWERLRARGEGGDRGWDGWMASPTQWRWVWANSGRQWRTGKPGVLQSMESQRVRHDLATEHQQEAEEPCGFGTLDSLAPLVPFPSFTASRPLLQPGLGIIPSVHKGLPSNLSFTLDLKGRKEAQAETDKWMEE